MSLEQYMKKLSKKQITDLENTIGMKLLPEDLKRLYLRGHVQLVKVPEPKAKELLIIKKKLSLNVSLDQLIKASKNLPYTVIDRILNDQYDKLIQQTELEDYLEFVPDEVVDYGFGTWYDHKHKTENARNTTTMNAENTTQPKELNPQCILDIAQLITNQNADVMREITNCVNDVSAYFAAHQAKYEERGITDTDDIYKIWWIGLVDLLIDYHYACELDWKAEIEDFLYFVQELIGIKESNLAILPEWFSEDGDVAEWCHIIDEKWNTVGICMAALDINSDSYVLFPYAAAKMDLLKKYAQEIGFSIDLAENM